MKVNEIGRINEKIGLPQKDQAQDKEGFVSMLASKISEVNEIQEGANKAIENLVTGREKNIHQTMIAVEKAEIAFKMMNKIRGKVIEAYQEIMRMQV